MDTLINDLIIYICEYLDDRSIIQFLSSTRQNHLAKNKINYSFGVNIIAIQNLWYINSFTYVYVNTRTYYDDIANLKFPNRTKTLKIREINDRIFNYTPASVTHLILDHSTYNVITYLPSNISHLTISRFFLRESNNYFLNMLNIVSCVTHLTLYISDYENIANINIINVSNVTHIKLLFYSKQDINQINQDFLSKLSQLNISRNYPYKINVPDTCIIVKF